MIILAVDGGMEEKRMKVAIFSDVHGNLTALEAVLADIAYQAPDRVVFAGDLCMFGARPSRCVQRLQAENHIISVYGNTDEWIADPPTVDAEMTEKRQQQIQNVRDNAAWTRTRLSEAEFSWLQTFFFSLCLSPSSQAEDDLLIVHANPQDVMAPIFPTAEAQQARTGHVSSTQTNDDLAPLLAGVAGGVVAFGHIHFPNVRWWGDIQLANISSVSLPLDEDPRAKYGLLQWENGRWHIQHQYVTYDVEAERQALAQIKPPDWERLSDRLG